MNKAKNILYLSYDGMTDPLGQSQVLPYIIGLTKAGYKFTLVSFEKEERFELNKNTIKQICKANNIDWQPLKYTKRPPVLSTLWDIYKLNKKVKKIRKQKEIELLHCRSYITALVGLGFKRKYNVKFLFDMRGFWADERVDGELWDISKFPFKQIFSYFKKKEIQFLNESDGIISLTHEGKKEILSWKNIDIAAGKISVIPTCVDLELFDYKKYTKQESNKLKSKMGIANDCYVLMYLGSLGTWYMLDEMLDYFKIVLEEKVNAKFVIYTADEFEIVYSKAKEKKIDISKIITKTLTRPEVPLHISIADSSISFIKPFYSKKASSPTKMGEIFGMGIPMICNDNVGDVEKIVTDYSCGVLVREFNKRAYLRAHKVLDGNKELAKMCSQESKEVFSLDSGLINFKTKYKDILQ